MVKPRVLAFLQSIRRLFRTTLKSNYVQLEVTMLMTYFTLISLYHIIRDDLKHIFPGSHSDFLSCDSSSGQITIAKLMDSEATTFDFSGLSLSVTDLGGNQATSAFDLTISDYNDNIPTFSQDYYDVTVNDGSSSGILRETESFYASYDLRDWTQPLKDLLADNWPRLTYSTVNALDSNVIVN